MSLRKGVAYAVLLDLVIGVIVVVGTMAWEWATR